LAGSAGMFEVFVLSAMMLQNYILLGAALQAEKNS
jgi:hypothetical protein